MTRKFHNSYFIKRKVHMCFFHSWKIILHYFVYNRYPGIVCLPIYHVNIIFIFLLKNYRQWIKNGEVVNPESNLYILPHLFYSYKCYMYNDPFVVSVTCQCLGSVLGVRVGSLRCKIHHRILNVLSPAFIIYMHFMNFILHELQ